MNMTKRFRLLKPMPSHTVGDILSKYLDEAEYQWESGDKSYTLPISLVESDANFFEEIIGNFTEGQLIYFISSTGKVIEEEFIYARHKELIEFKNIFTDSKSAELACLDLNKFLSGECYLFTKEDIEAMYISLLNNDISSVKSKLSDLI
jgi:hypothetical protein